MLARLEAARVPVHRVSVTAKDADQSWCITVLLEAGRQIAAAFPYADHAGIHTPRELAEWFTERAIAD